MLPLIHLGSDLKFLNMPFDKISFIKGKVAGITEDAGELVLDVEDTINREKLHNKFDMAVLATGMVPNSADLKIPFELCCWLYITMNIVSFI